MSDLQEVVRTIDYWRKIIMVKLIVWRVDMLLLVLGVLGALFAQISSASANQPAQPSYAQKRNDDTSLHSLQILAESQAGKFTVAERSYYFSFSLFCLSVVYIIC